MPPPKNKDAEIKARVTKGTKAALDKIAAERGERTSIIVREAVGEYLTARGRLTEPDTSRLVDEPAQYASPPRKVRVIDARPPEGPPPQ